MGGGSMHKQRCKGGDAWSPVAGEPGLPHGQVAGHPLPSSPSPQPGVADQHRIVGGELCGEGGKDGRGSNEGALAARAA